ncbi:MAG TPA: DNA repair protein RecO [Devosia sp.]|jgi:DNA repair protein RecO (recombination protein O)|uniref:DNA repair protein RecO n=1 Tax=Devosia sp. TaxID=1871048 RepID=UPI002DDCB89A|nr:DNA repair protein RecO [Devosia sp.]HEV2516841.1 DNA repair protein RecO [Devosia sp.]
MQWDGEGLIVGVRRHGESSVIAEVMVEGRGRHLGLIRGGRSSKLAATLQPGNSVQVSWRARLEEHLGTFTLELLEARAAGLIADRAKLYASQIVCEHLRLLPERDPHDRLLGLAIRILDQAGSRLELGASVARFELILLDELGFGLDLSSCAATGVTRDLTHVSPKSGRAVSRAAAEPYLSRLLRLPQFLIGPADPTFEDVGNAFALTGHFLDMHVWLARQLEPPAIRETFIELVSKPTD